MKRTMKKAVMIGFTAALMAGMALPALAAGWQQDEKGWYYEAEDGSFLNNGFKDVDGKTYLFDEAGYQLTGWQYVKWQWYYMGTDGAMAKGWTQIGADWHYFGSDGVMKTGWLDEGGKRFYLRDNGAMAVGLLQINGLCYCTDETGALIRQQKIDDKTSFDQDGVIKYYDAKTKEWNYMPDDEGIIVEKKRELRRRYESRAYGSRAEFETEARSILGQLLEEDEVTIFIGDIEEDFPDIYPDLADYRYENSDGSSGYYNDDTYDSSYDYEEEDEDNWN